MIEQIEWIACAERLPELGDDVLCYATDRIPPVMVAWLDADDRGLFWRYASTGSLIEGVTHWSTMPAGPRG